MIRLGAAALAALVACGGASAAAADGVTAVAMTPGRARPAESGGHDSPATRGPLAIGANVVDRSGAEIGRVTRVTTDTTGRQIAEVRQNETVYSIPLDDLYAHGGAAFSALSLDELKRNGAAH